MSSTLFRTEVLEARRHQWLGAVSLDQPPTLRWLALLAVAAAGAVALALARGEYTRRTAVSGVLVPDLGVATVVAPVAGTVVALAADEGDRVLAGDRLATIAIPNATTHGAVGAASAASIAQRQRAVAAARSSRQRAIDGEADAAARQHALARGELAGLDAELATRRRQVALAEAAAERFRALAARRYVSGVQVQQQEAAALEQVAAVQALERQALAMRRQLAQLEQALAAVPERRADADATAARDLALLDHEAAQLQARRDAVVAAPVTGRVATRLVEPGQPVQAGQPLLALLPAAATLEVHLLAPGHAVGTVAPGDRVLLRYAAFPYQKHGQHPGRVARVSGVALPADAATEPLFRIVVVPERQHVGRSALRAGGRVDAHLLGERRRLWEWVLEPLQSLRAVAGAPADGEGAGVPPAATARDAVGNVVAPGATSRAGLRVPSPRDRTACAASAHAPAGDDANASPGVGTPPMAADPGANGLLAPPASRGHQPGACDA